jgi:hypothetical protein
MGLPFFPETDFDAVIDAYGKKNAVIIPLFVYLDLVPTPLAVWGGEYDLESGGVNWLGLKKGSLVGAVEGLEYTSSVSGSDATLTLSGVSSDVTALLGQGIRSDYVGRLSGFYLQWCGTSGANLWQPLCPPYAIRAGFMGPMRVDRAWQQNDDGSGQWVRTIKLPVWNLFAGRNNAPNSLWTDRDQQNRYPGDKFFTYMKNTEETLIPVPWFKGG